MSCAPRNTRDSERRRPARSRLVNGGIRSMSQLGNFVAAGRKLIMNSWDSWGVLCIFQFPAINGRRFMTSPLALKYTKQGSPIHN